MYQIFFCLSLVTTCIVNLPGQTELGLFTRSDQTVRAVHSWCEYPEEYFHDKLVM